ncbi:MAG: EscT/YscT/HrcT family type III secretion system export apparatus protein [Chlamydiales bacterium]
MPPFFNTDISEAELTHYLSLFLLTILRLGPIVRLAPFLGAKVMPGMARMGLILILGVIFFPNILVYSTSGPFAFNLVFIGYAFKELILGYILGFFSTVPFLIANSAGIFIDFVRGSSMLMQQDITLQQQASPLGILYNSIFIVIFYQLNGIWLFFDAVTTSYQILPPSAWFNASLFSLNTPLWSNALTILHSIIAISLQLAAPSLVAILMAEIFLGIANRLAPQVQIIFLGMPIKSLLGIFFLWAGWFFILPQANKQLLAWFRSLEQIIYSFKLFI